MSGQNNKTYVLDTNVLIDFARYLPISLNTFFWSKMEEYLKSSRWILLDVVVGEIDGYPNGLLDWCKKQGKFGLIRKIDSDSRLRAVEINNQYKMIDEITRQSEADPYLIAYAEANNLVVFSRESKRKSVSDPYKIPDVCNVLNVERIAQPQVFLEAVGYSN